MSGWSNNDLTMMASYGEYDGAFSVIVVVFVYVVWFGRHFQNKEQLMFLS